MGNSTARILGLKATPLSIPANGNAQSTLVATVEDANGNLVGPGIPVAWTSTDGLLSSSTTTTDSSSKATVNLTAPVTAGSAQVTAQAAAGSANATITFTADGSTAKVIDLTATPATIIANGVATSALEASVEDATGNPVPNAAVTWTTSAGTLSAASSSTDASGKARVTLKGTAAGSASVKATAAAGASTATVTLTADSSTAKVIGLVATPATIVANGIATSSLEATVEDASGNPVPNAAVTWTTSTGSLSAASSTTDASGKARVTLKGTATGSASVQATASAGASTATVTLIADSSTAKVIDLTATPATIVANGTATSSLEATVEDASGHPVPNAAVTWTTSTGSLSAASSTTDASGKARVTLKGTAAGSASVKATASAGASTATVTLTADSSTAKVIGLVAMPATIVANGVATSALEATVEDANGNPVPNASVTWTTSTGSLSAASSTTDASGKARVTLKGTATGSASVQAMAAAGASTATVTLTADSSTAKVLNISASPATVPADGTVTTLSATVTDANNNPLGAGITVLWQTDLNTLSAASSVTDSNGVAVVTLQGTTSGTATVLAKTTVSGNASIGVIFAALNPVIISLTENAGGLNNAVFTDESGRLVVDPYPKFNWSVSNATKYELYSPNGLIYSGTASTFTIPFKTRITNTTSNRLTFTLRAYNGAIYVEKQITLENTVRECTGCQSGS
ncbi:Ig-like domain-containing protein [Serratia proteamaculans]|uniref:Ig-like domain-containing protein n=1 Tax=Serratia proteamaculans TaxID=28151 RepID=UPI003D05A88C